MNFMRLTRPLLVATALVTTAPFATTAVAQAPAISPGMQVVDVAGNPVGMVTSVKDGLLIVKTDRHEAQLPATSFTPNKGKLLFAMTREQLNASIEAELAAANASLVAGTSVYGTGGAIAGVIEAIDDSIVTLKLTSGEMIRLPRSGIAPSDKGAVLGVSAAELKAMANAAAEAASTEAAAPADSAAGADAAVEAGAEADAPSAQ